MLGVEKGARAWTASLVAVLVVLSALSSTVYDRVPTVTGLEIERVAVDYSSQKVMDASGQGYLTPISPTAWDLGRTDKWSDFAIDKDSAQLVIGVQPNKFADVVDLIRRSGGTFIHEISMGKEVAAVVADVPFGSMSPLVAEARASDMYRYLEPNVRFHADFEAADPYWNLQWGPKKIGAPYAWNTTVGDRGVLVAVVDTGIDYLHSDLASNYVPYGSDFVSNDKDPMDDYGHGTHIAGIIAASINNEIGIAGLAQVGIMAEKGLDNEGTGWEVDLARAIVDAVDEKEARNTSRCIMNLSWGDNHTSMLIHDAIKYAYDHGVLVIGSAGNEGTDAKHYPAAYDEVIAVAATNKSDGRCDWSSFGDWVEVAAPGSAIYSTFPHNSYSYMSGTSMSAAYATGVAALIWSRFPWMTRDQVRAQLRYTAEDLGEPGFDDLYGYGRVDAKRAVEIGQTEHDLVVMGWQKPLYAKVGEWITINTTVLNSGKSDENDATVQLLIDNEIVNTSRIGPLKSGKSVTVSCSARPEVPYRKIYNLTSYVVPVPGETAKKGNIDQYVSDDKFWITIPMIISVGPSGHYNTIQKAVNFSLPEDTIQVDPGTYFEHITIDKPSLALYAKSGAVIDGNGTSSPLIEVRESNTHIEGFTMKNGSCGISLDGGGNNTIVGNIIIGNTRGITLSYSCGNILRRNEIIGNEQNFEVFGTDLSEFIQYIDTSNTVDGKPIYYWVNQQNKQIPSDAGCVVVVNSTNITVKDLTLKHNGLGMVLAYAKGCTIANLRLTNNSDGSILVFVSNDSIIYGNTISATLNGVDIYHSFNCTIRDNLIGSNSSGIVLTHSLTCTINNNTVSGAQYGVSLSSAANTTVTGNTVLNCTRGMILSQSGQSILRGNNVTGSSRSFGIYGYDLPGFILKIDTSNTIDGKPIYYLTNQNGLAIDPAKFASMGYMGIVNSTDITVRNMDLTGNDQGIMFAHTTNIIVEDVRAFENGNGIYASSSRNITLSSCNITHNVYGAWLGSSSGCTINGNRLANNYDGVYMDSCIESTIADNLAVNQTAHGFLLVYSFNCTVRNNKMAGNGFGLYLENCTSVAFTENTITGDSAGVILELSGNNLLARNNVTHCAVLVLGMEYSSFNIIKDNTFYENNLCVFGFGGSYNNSIYHNNLINPACNNPVFGVDLVVGDNNWDNGRQEGNYWSDYKGLDDGSGGRVKGDGIGDTNLPHVYFDYYPLMGPYLTGDVNHDGKVNIVDIAAVATAWWTTPGHPRWNLHADLDGNDLIDIRDIALAAISHGKKWAPPT